MAANPPDESMHIEEGQDDESELAAIQRAVMQYDRKRFDELPISRQDAARRTLNRIQTEHERIMQA